MVISLGAQQRTHSYPAMNESYVFRHGDVGSKFFEYTSNEPPEFGSINMVL